jgi:two-component system sensor histidine kinase PhoQ
MFASAIFMVLVLLPLLGLTIVNAYEKHMIASIKNELSAYSYSILAVAEVEEQQLQMPDLLLENQFNVSQSGLYASFTPQKNNQTLLWQSISLLTTDFALNKDNPLLGQSDFFQVEHKSSTYFVYSISVSFTSNDKPFDTTLHIIKAEDQFRLLMQEFKNKLWFSLMMLMLVFIVLQLIWLKWSLTPLATLKKELINVEQGQANCLEANYPKELKLVTNQLNTLLKTEQNQRKRYRNALADLAHSLKTPVAVIQSQGELSATSQEQLTAINAMVEHQLKRAQSSGQSAWHLGVKVSPCLAKLSRGLTKIYRDKHLDIVIDVEPELVFKGDESDLLELLGNLLDNACKAAAQQVKLTAYQQSSILVFQVEDDGSGIEESQRHEILQRGVRADTYKQGHGIGLAIVRDLVESYQGQLFIEHSNLLGGAKFILKF